MIIVFFLLSSFLIYRDTKLVCDKLSKAKDRIAQICRRQCKEKLVNTLRPVRLDGFNIWFNVRSTLC